MPIAFKFVEYNIEHRYAKHVTCYPYESPEFLTTKKHLLKLKKEQDSIYQVHIDLITLPPLSKNEAKRKTKKYSLCVTFK